MITSNEEREPEKATCLHMKVLGGLIVPRAETWAVLHVLLLTNGTKPLNIVTEAMSVINGFKLQNRHVYSEAKNGDIWREIFKRMD